MASLICEANLCDGPIDNYAVRLFRETTSSLSTVALPIY